MKAIYGLKQAPRYESKEYPSFVCRLDKAIYGLKQLRKPGMLD
jgi:hypothetical protein